MGVMTRGATGMAQMVDDGRFGTVMQAFTQALAAKLNEAAAIARTASTLGAEGLSDRAFQALLEAEPLIHDAQVLVNASSIMRRRERGDPPFG